MSTSIPDDGLSFYDLVRQWCEEHRQFQLKIIEAKHEMLDILVLMRANLNELIRNLYSLVETNPALVKEPNLFSSEITGIKVPHGHQTIMGQLSVLNMIRARIYDLVKDLI
jgi:hypothetical protein